MNNEPTIFVAGTTYETRSICDHNCVWAYKVVRRTAKTVWIEGPMIDGVEKRRIQTMDGVEFIYPQGQFSMAPTIKATKAVPQLTLNY